MANLNKKLTNDEKRYFMYKKVIEMNRSNHLDRSNIWVAYMEQINKARYSHEIDDVLDAIIVNEEQIRKYGKGNIK